MKISLIVIGLIFQALVGCSQDKKVTREPHPGKKELSGLSQATFAAGCFWHEEAMFESIKGVKEAVAGYAGGTTKDPTYENIEMGNTGHAETVNVYYDSSKIDFPTLVKIYFAGQDPTQVNGQGPDRGSQYRSIAFYRNNVEKEIIEKYKRELQKKYSEPVAAEIKPFTHFWIAEEYHQDFIEKNPSQGYVLTVSIPEIRKLQKQYPELVKQGYQY